MIDRMRWMMVLALAAAMGCMTNAQYLAQNSSAALSTAKSRAEFELDCQTVSAKVLSDKVIQGPLGAERAEYTVGVSGCGKRAVYLTICLDPENCNALGDSARIDAGN